MTDKVKSSHGRARWLIVLLTTVALIALLLAAAACGDDDDDDDTGDGGDATATESADNGNGGNGGNETTSAEDGSEASSDLSALAADYEDFTGVIKYQTTGFGDDSFTSMKIYKGEDSSRVDFEGSGSTGTVITTPDAFYYCSEGTCIKYSSGDTSIDPTAGLTAFLSADNINSQFSDLPDGVDVEKSDEEIAGVDATCYTYSGDVDDTESGDESGKICFSDSGLLLKLDFDSASGGGSFVAVEASDSVDDGDFDPPFPVTELPNIGQ